MPWPKNRPRPLATRTAISQALEGRARPSEVRAKISAGKMGKKATRKHREAIRVAHRVIALFKPEVAAAQSARSRTTMLRNWQDPAFVARWHAGREAYRRRLKCRA